jgi:sulfatase modifying factor 1
MKVNHWVACGVLGFGVMTCVGCAGPITKSDVNQAVSAYSSAIDPIQLLSRAEAPTLALVKPPGNPRSNHFYIKPEDLAKLPVLQQPPELAQALAAMQVGSIDARKEVLKAKVLKDMVYVRGGSFMRGDFASLMGIEGVSRMTSKSDDKVVKEITLSDFWISKYKVTYAEFDVFTDAAGRPRTGTEFEGRRRHPPIPARAYWHEAKNYCQWLAQLTGLPIDLPTEAQWEYAARSRGQFFVIATDDGNVEYGRNVPYQSQSKVLSPFRELSNYPGGLFPANPLGLHDMSTNGVEWVNDWYAEDAYSTVASVNPQGPAAGTHKVVRSGGADSPLIGSTVHRYKRDPSISIKDDDGNMVPAKSVTMPALRCAVTPR